jgi:hypothetical protein
MDERFRTLALEMHSDQLWASIKSLYTISNNLCSTPTDERYRYLRESNPIVSKTILAQAKPVAFLRLLGFHREEYGDYIISQNDSLRTARAALEALVMVGAGPPQSISRTLSATGERGLKISRVCTPSVSWRDVGGLAAVKRQLMTYSQAPLGRLLLLYGPPKSGKALVATACAAAWGCRVLTVFARDLDTPFARSRHGALGSFLNHACDIAPCVVLLRGS